MTLKVTGLTVLRPTQVHVALPFPAQWVPMSTEQP
ncbi:hypothetical protein ABIE67_001194 [Streptomyces sp. V4I8]